MTRNGNQHGEAERQHCLQPKASAGFPRREAGLVRLADEPSAVAIRYFFRPAAFRYGSAFADHSKNNFEPNS